MTQRSTLAYLGPEGSFTHQAAMVLAPEGGQLCPMESLEAVLDALGSDRVDFAVAALMSAAGPITLTQQGIESGAFEVRGEHAISISFDLYRRQEDFAPLKGVVGHEKALAQLEDWITSQSLLTQAFTSNTAGLSAIAGGDEPGWGAVGPAGLADTYQLRLAAEAVQGTARLETRFVLLRRSEN